MAKRKIKFALSCTSAILLIAVQITFGTLCFYFGESRIAPIERCCWSTVDTRERESIGGFGTEAIHECGFDRLEVPDLGIGGKSSVIIVALRRRKTLCQTNVRECALHPPPHFKVNRVQYMAGPATFLCVFLFGQRRKKPPVWLQKCVSIGRIFSTEFYECLDDSEGGNLLD